MARYYGRNHIVADTPFYVNGEKIVKPVYFPLEGEPVTITAGDSPVYIGGMEYDGVELRSRPFVIEPGRSARVTLRESGDSLSLGKWDVTLVR